MVEPVAAEERGKKSSRVGQKKEGREGRERTSKPVGAQRLGWLGFWDSGLIGPQNKEGSVCRICTTGFCCTPCCMICWHLHDTILWRFADVVDGIKLSNCTEVMSGLLLTWTLHG